MFGLMHLSGAVRCTLSCALLMGVASAQVPTEQELLGEFPQMEQRATSMLQAIQQIHPSTPASCVFIYRGTPPGTAELTITVGGCSLPPAGGPQAVNARMIQLGARSGWFFVIADSVGTVLSIVDERVLLRAGPYREEMLWGNGLLTAALSPGGWTPGSLVNYSLWAFNAPPMQAQGYLLISGDASLPTPLTGLGILLLSSPLACVPMTRLTPVQFVANLTIPNNPQLVGQDFFSQGILVESSRAKLAQPFLFEVR